MSATPAETPATVPPEVRVKKWKTYPGRLEFLHARIEFFIDDFKTKRDRSRNRANAFTLASILLGMSLTILLGLKPTFSSWHVQEAIAMCALVISAAVTAMNSWIAFSDYKWKWIRYRATLSMLYNIRDEMRYRESSGRPLDDRDIDGIFEQLKRTVHETNQEWMNQRGNAIAGFSSGGDGKGAK